MQGESNSITNQKKYLEEYARSQGFKNIRHFTDDGYSGVDFNRPGFQALIAAVEAGEVDVVCVKDMSRFGRNYLKVGFYTEIMFPEKVSDLSPSTTAWIVPIQARMTSLRFEHYERVVRKGHKQQNPCYLPFKDAGRKTMQRCYPLWL